MEAERKDWDSLPEKCQRFWEVAEPVAVAELVEATVASRDSVTSTGSVTDSVPVTVDSVPGDGIRLPNG